MSRADVRPDRLVLLLKQSAGVPNNPLVKKGDKVAQGQPLGEIPKDALGAILHAPFAGTVTDVAGDRIILNRLP